MIVTLDENHTYVCNHTASKRIFWRMNGRVLGVEVNNIPGIEYTDRFSHPGGAEVYTLTIRALPQYNQTTIQCTAGFDDGSPPEYTPSVVFLIQGYDPLS